LSTESILDGLSNVRDVIIAKALTDAISVSGHPGDAARLPHRSEQYWLQAFSSPDVTSDQMRTFLGTFQSIRAGCDYGEAADLVNELIGKRDFDPLTDVETLAGALRVVTERRISQTVAAASICTFAKPNAQVFAMGDLHCYSARLVLWARSDRSTPSLLGVPFHDDGWEAGDGVRGDYVAYASACSVVLDELRSMDAFRNALRRYTDYLDSVPGPMRTRETVALEFIERRLLDKLMACEGWYIRYWLENERQMGRLAPSDEGLVVSRVVPRRSQDVFATELAVKLGYRG
jgi:hypothetical protein